MTSNDEAFETIEGPEVLTDQDQKDLEAMWGEQTNGVYRSVLLIWDELIKPENIATNKAEGISMQWATIMCGRYPQVTYEATIDFHGWYFEFLEKLADVLHEHVAVLKADEHDPLGAENAEEDVANNHDSFIHVLTEWQLALLDFELAWRPDIKHAAAYVAALGEVQQFFFGERGLTGHLEAIKFEFTDEDTAALAGKLAERQASAREGEQ